MINFVLTKNKLFGGTAAHLYSTKSIGISLKDIGDGGSTLLYTAYTVDTVDIVYTVDTIDMVDTVFMVYTVDIVYTVDMVYNVDNVYTIDTVYTIQTASHCFNSCWADGMWQTLVTWVMRSTGLTGLMGVARTDGTDVAEMALRITALFYLDC